MPLNFRESTLRDFSGGLTDRYIKSPLNQFKEATNFFITEDFSMKSRPGGKLFYEEEAVQRIMNMFNLNEDLLAFRGQQLYRYNDGTGLMDNITVPNPANPFLQFTGDSAFVNGYKWRDQILVTNEGLTNPTRLNRPMKAFRDDAGILKGLELGMPEFDGASVTINFAGDPGFLVQLAPTAGLDEVYVWAFHWSYEYQIGDTTYRSDGPVYLTRNYYMNYPIGPLAGADDNIEFLFSTLPTIGTVDNQYDVTNVTLKIYRTVSGGDDFFLVSELPHGSVGITDNVTDADLVNREPLYINGGVLDTYPAPKCKFITVVNDIPYYGYVEDETSGDIKPFRVIQGDPGSDTHSPTAFRDVDDEIRGLSNINGFPILFTKSFIYRLEGSFDNTGGGSLRPRVISETVGIASHNSAIRTDKVVYFIGRDGGVFFTDGYTVEQLPASLTLFNTIRSFVFPYVRGARIAGAYDTVEERIIWSVGDNESENNKWLVLNLNTLSFTIASGRSFFSSSVIFREGSILRGDDSGYIFEHRDGFVNDDVREVGVPSAQWGTSHIPWRLETVAIDYGSPAVKKWVPYLTTSIKSQTNYSVLASTNNDDERVVKDLKFIRSWGTFYWGDPTFIWGNPEIKWRKQETESHKRHFPKGTLRCRRKQIAYEPADVVVYKSDNYGLADAVYVDPLEPLDFNVSLQSGNDWPSDCKYYDISFEETGYTTRHEILSVSGNTIQVAGGNLLPGNGKKWQIIGKYKNQEVEFKTITTNFAYLADEGNEFKAGDSGGNA